jgi:hypothetical protein
MRPNSPEIFLALGESQMKLAATLKDPDHRDHLQKAASDAFQWTLELDPKNAQARKHLARLNPKESPAPKK